MIMNNLRKTFKIQYPKKLMLKRLFFTALLAFSTLILWAQNENASLILQSPHGKDVKMIWFIKSWEKRFTGFDIKRKEGIQKDWNKINKAPIVPGIAAKKDLSNVESDKAEAVRIKMLMAQYLAKHQLEEIDSVTFQKNSLSGSQFLQNFSKKIFEDYDIALMSGFAFVDHAEKKRIDYEYGLFIAGTDIQLASAKWNYGEVPDLNVITDITTRSIHKKRGVQLIWDVDIKKLKTGYIHGFNIYRDGIRLNQAPVMISLNNSASEFEWFDSTANSDIGNQYSIGSESLLDIEGIIKTYTYNPADHPENYLRPDISEITSMGYYFKEGIQVKWSFPKEYEKYIDGYIIEKDNLPSGFSRVCVVSDPAARDCIDKTPSPVGSYIRYKMTVLYKDRTQLQSRERVYSYFPIRDPPPPLGVKNSMQNTGRSFKIHFSWDMPMVGDSLTEYYSAYFLGPDNNHFAQVTGAEKIKGNSWDFETPKGKSGTYKFYLTASSKYGSEGSPSDTILINIPALTLPVPLITQTSDEDNSVVLKWSYPDGNEIKGFRIFENNQLIATEKEVPQSVREYKISDLEVKTKYEFTIQAVDENGICSPASLPSSVTTGSKYKKH